MSRFSYSYSTLSFLLGYKYSKREIYILRR
nr:MAG TPA: hypothetical protein [Caudoviricetes sp.]